MADLSKRMARRWLKEHEDATPMQVADAMRQYDRGVMEMPRPPSDPVADLMDEFDERRRTPFVATGITDLDNMLNGIRRKELTAIGARPSVGKSAFCQQVAMHVARRGRKVLYFPLEMSANAVVERMFMRYVNIPQYEVRRGLKDETWGTPQVANALNQVNEFFKDGNLLIFERCNDLQVIRALIRENKPFMVVIDQLEQLKDGKKFWQNKRERFSHMTHELQGLAMDMDVAVWLACQVNRNADGSAPTMANLKESGTIEEDSDNVILLHRDGDKTPQQNIVLDLAKQRNGECGTVNLIFQAPKYAFYGQDGRY